MAIDAGTVYYTVDANTQKAIDAATDMKTSLEDMQQSMAKTDMQAKQYAKSLNEAGNSVSKAGVVLDKFGNVNSEATAKMQRLMAMSDALNQKHIELSKTATGVRRGIAGMGRNAGQAGIQFQQLIGQVQGGQDVMLALSQQSADLGFVLGAPLLGAVVGIGASIAGMLLPNLFKTTDALEDVEKATENVKAAITLSSEGVVGYSEKMKVLANVSESLARIKLANIIADQSAAMQTASKGINETLDEFRGLNFETELFGKRSEQATRIFIELSEVARNFEADPQGSIERFESSLKAAEEAGINTTESGRKLVRVITDLVAQYKLGELTISQLKEQLDGTKLSFDDVAESATKYDNLLKRLTIRSNETKTAQLEQEKALVMLEKGFQELEPEKQQAIADAYDLVIANTREAESEKALAKAKRETAAAERESRKASKAFIQDFGIEGDEFGESPDGEATEFSRTITSSYNENETLERLQRERDMILLYQELEIGDAQAHAEALIAIDKQIMKERVKSNEFVSQSLDALGQSGTSAITGLLTGTMSLQQAMMNLASTILNQAVGAMVEIGVEYLKNQMIGESAAAASAATAAATGSTIAAAYAPAATAASIATQGGAVAAGQAAMASGVPAMNGLLLAGGRQYGGPVAANSMYRINENGAPEVFNAANGQQYMLPNTRGEVVSNKDASGGGNTYITVQVNSDGTATTNGGSAMQQFGTEIGQFVEAKFKQLEAQSIRQGGTIWQYSQKGRR
ncbi:tail tape measure protein [Vibrio phage vB_VaM_H2]|nr:tail tape measure protein [Vibrio phage vB_VaM_H2]